ncbi:ribonuclease P protein component [Algoriphagus taiwanensis]|uniref:Ribonuclease P protein component n=1 Tax=Algoriphagus taiwanensis TaxID=1445656 RepID=A0ABQ6Q8D8_9BACT|nr:ribonuclease P protein component [Algoriphagus taiwanensis]
MNFRLPKSERLNADKLIKELFNEGSSFFLYPFKVVFLAKEKREGEVNQILISVSKKKLKKAVDRNRVKRKIREAYRLNKHKLSPEGIVLGFIFVGNPEMNYSEFEAKMIASLEKLQKEKSPKSNADEH